MFVLYRGDYGNGIAYIRAASDDVEKLIQIAKDEMLIEAKDLCFNYPVFEITKTDFETVIAMTYQEDDGSRIYSNLIRRFYIKQIQLV